MAQRLYNTLARGLVNLVPHDPSRITFYTCGPTVYDDAHIGNFRSFLAADVLRRWLESPLCEVKRPDGSVHTGPRTVVHVMNITDVGHMTDDSQADGGGEDKMAVAGRRIEEAKKSGKLPKGVDVDPNDPFAIADFYATRFIEDAKDLGLKVASEADADPSLMPRPTHIIEKMIALVKKLISEGHAYAVGEPGHQVVYFDVQSFPDYGQLSGNTLDALRTGAGGRISAQNQSSKKHPADFMLWKSDATHLMKWPSPWGEGYPGWHLECSVMAHERLGLEAGGVIDLHSGGEDNIFPHHECEIAQSRCAHHTDAFARVWFHPRFLMVDGQKMSKSKGTFFTARDLFATGVEPAALRLELVKTHYRSNANFMEQGLKDSQRMVERWRRFAEKAAASSAAGSRNDEVARAFADAMHEDMNVAGALGVLNKWVAETSGPTKADLSLLMQFDAVLGILERAEPETSDTSIGVFLDGLAPDPEVIALLEARAAARAAKDFAASDRIRDELASRNLAIKDMAGGKVEVRRG